MEEIEKGHCHICFQQPRNALLDFEPYEDLIQKLTQIKTEISRLILNKICESCAKELIIIDIFRTRFIEANEKWTKMLGNQNEPESRPKSGPKPKNRCEECGKWCEMTSIDLQTWKRVCSDCSTMELMNVDDIKEELPFSVEEMMVQTLDHSPEEKIEFPNVDHSDKSDVEWPHKVSRAPKRGRPSTYEKLKPKRKIPEKVEPVGECNECKRTFSTFYDLELHKEIGHNGSCKYCNYKHHSSTTLRSHVLSHLPHLWPNLCEVCGARFAQNAAFRFHHASHDPEKFIYKCHFCSIGFPRKVSLRDHIVKRHLRIRRFQCGYCPKNYMDLTDKVRHEYIHTGKYPFWCTLCNHGFPRKRELNKHMLKHE